MARRTEGEVRGTTAAAVALGGVVLGALGLVYVVPVTNDSVGRDAAACISAAMFLGGLGGFLRDGWWPRVTVMIVASLVGVIAAGAVIDHGGTAGIVVVAVTSAITVVAACLPLRSNQAGGGPEPQRP